ncbi:hypothetical protein Q2T76_01920 [Lactobacillus sp. YT155]|uniref:hypothetical protein n=1 Tax=Lactobacillus sp. YT155 TaxID=3060955 RepID=UPI00265D654A|nr:hypothetical protein [Lactobacillus sp. YT155]MDO1604806.1 hypothetical protein [Lactobacillus sp. YT155]
MHKSKNEKFIFLFQDRKDKNKSGFYYDIEKDQFLKEINGKPNLVILGVIIFVLIMTIDYLNRFIITGNTLTYTILMNLFGMLLAWGCVKLLKPGKNLKYEIINPSKEEIKQYIERTKRNIGNLKKWQKVYYIMPILFSVFFLTSNGIGYSLPIIVAWFCVFFLQYDMDQKRVEELIEYLEKTY